MSANVIILNPPRRIPRTATSVEEPGMHLASDQSVCPHCEAIYEHAACDEVAAELRCCPKEACKVAAIAEIKAHHGSWETEKQALELANTIEIITAPGSDVLLNDLACSVAQVLARQIKQRLEGK